MATARGASWIKSRITCQRIDASPSSSQSITVMVFLPRQRFVIQDQACLSNDDLERLPARDPTARGADTARCYHWFGLSRKCNHPAGRRLGSSGSHGFDPSSSARPSYAGISCQSLTQAATCLEESSAERTPVRLRSSVPVESPILPGLLSATTSRSFFGVPTC